MIGFTESNFYKSLQDFFINNYDKEAFLEMLGEFYNRTEGIILKNDGQDELIKELREMFLLFNENGIDENIVREKVEYFIENSEKISDIITKIIKNTNNIKNITSQMDNIQKYSEDIKYSKILFDEFKNENETNNQCLERIMRLYCDEGIEIIFTKNTYNFEHDITINNSIADNNYAKLNRIKLTSNVRSTFEFSSNSNFAIIIGKNEWQYDPINNYAKGYIEVEINNITLKNTSTNVNKNGVLGLNARRINIINCELLEFNNGIELIGAWDKSNIVKTKIHSKNINGNGIILRNGSNAITIENNSIIQKENGILIEGKAGYTGSITSTWIFKNVIESCNNAIKISPLNTNVGGINIKNNHFEYNTTVLNIENNSTIWGVYFEGNASLGYGGVKIGNDNNSFDIKSLIFDNNSFLSSRDEILDLGSSIPDKIFNFRIGNIATYGNFNIKKPVARLLANNQTSFYETMPLFNGGNDTPVDGRGSKLGRIGEIRWDENNMYIKCQNTWRYIPTGQRSTYERHKKHRYSGVINIPSQTVNVGQQIDYQFELNGVVPDSGYVVSINPSKSLPTGLIFNSWISSDNKVNLRLTNISSTSVTTTTQNWFYDITIIDN